MTTGRVEWPFVGRDAQLAELTALLDDPMCGGVIIGGPAGVGKTRLADEVLRVAAARGAPAGRVVATPAAQTMPYSAIAHLIPQEVLGSSGPIDAVRLFAAIRELSAGGNRLVVLVDDVVFLDEATLSLALQLHAADALFLIGTVRTGSVIPPGLDTVIRSFGLRRIELGELSEVAVGAAAEAAVGAPLEPMTVARLWQRSGGNALYVRELLLSALSAGSISMLPSGHARLELDLTHNPRLVELVGERVRGIAGEVGNTLALVAVAEPLLVSDLESLGLVDHAIELEQRGLVRVDAAGGDSYVRLSHPLHGEVLRTTMGTLAYRRQVQRAIEVLSSRSHPLRDDPLRIAMWQLDIGLPAPHSVLLAGARLARSAMDLPSTIRLATAAQEAKPTPIGQHLLAESLFLTGRAEDAERVAATPLTPEATPLNEVVIVAVRVNNLLWNLHDTAKALDVVAAHRQSLTAAGLQAMITIIEANVHAADGRSGKALELLGPQPENPLELLLSANARATAQTIQGRFDETIALCDTAYRMQMALPDPKAYLDPNTHLLTRGEALVASGQFADADASLAQVHAAALEERVPFMRSWVALVLGDSALQSGRLDDARLWYSDARAAADEVHLPPGLRIAVSGVAAAIGQQGDAAAAATMLAELESIEPDIHYHEAETAIGKAWCLTALGRRGEARDVLHDAIAQSVAFDEPHPVLMAATEAARLGDPEWALDVLEPFEGRVRGPLAAAKLAFVRALAGRTPDRFATAEAALTALGANLLAAEAAVALADALRRTGQTREAAAAVGRAQALLAKCQGARTPGSTVVDAAVPLSAREREVALLAADGLSSKEIADRLYLSVRTVDNHLQNAYTKLGVSGRSELADAIR